MKHTAWQHTQTRQKDYRRTFSHTNTQRTTAKIKIVFEFWYSLTVARKQQNNKKSLLLWNSLEKNFQKKKKLIIFWNGVLSVLYVYIYQPEQNLMCVFFSCSLLYNSKWPKVRNSVYIFEYNTCVYRLADMLFEFIRRCDVVMCCYTYTNTHPKRVREIEWVIHNVLMSILPIELKNEREKDSLILSHACLALTHTHTHTHSYENLYAVAVCVGHRRVRVHIRLKFNCRIVEKATTTRRKLFVFVLFSLCEYTRTHTPFMVCLFYTFDCSGSGSHSCMHHSNQNSHPKEKER